MGDWWYLLFSEFTERCVTRYRMARSLRGPWLTPDEDTFDGRAFYAAKTASDGQRRFLFGWNPTRDGENGHRRLAVGRQPGRARGRPAAGWDAGRRCAGHCGRGLRPPRPVTLRPGLGECRLGERSASVAAPGSFGCAVGGALPETCKIEASVTFTEGTRGCGLMLRASDDLESAYYIRIEPHRQRLVLDLWPRAGDVPHLVELERPLALAPGVPVELKVFVDGTVCEVYAAGVAMSARLYNLKSGDWGVFVSDGSARFEDLTVKMR